MLKLIRLAACVAWLSIVATAPAGRAQAAEADDLGLRVAHQVLSAIDFGPLIEKELKGSMGGTPMLAQRPEWEGQFRDAVGEEITSAMPKIEAIFGRLFARQLTLEELHAGETILSDPFVRSVMQAASRSQTEPVGRAGKAADRAAATPAGRSFMKRFENMESMASSLEGDIAGALLPGVFRRIADKIEASEAARAASPQPAVK